jgi:hypothetical protein
MKCTKLFVGFVAITAVALAQATAWADSAAMIQTYSTGTGVTWDDNGSGNYPVVSAILTAPGVVGGRTYNNWSYLAQDPTGSLDLFYNSSVLPGYTPMVGDSILAQGNYSPFSGIPEIVNSAAHPLSITYGGSGNPLYTPVPVLTTIPTINVGTNGYGLSQSGFSAQLLRLQNVTISGLGPNWTPGANATGMITDQSGNGMTMFLWVTSYSTCGAIAANGDPVPAGLVDMTGFISDFYSTVTSSIVPEFVPTSITLVPEPMLTSLFGVGAFLGWIGYRRRNKA